MKISVIFFLCWIPLHLTAAYELGNPFIHNYTPDEYRGHPQNWGIIQDNRGVMYFSNTFGVLEFDGKNWNLIQLPNHSWPVSLAIDRESRIYVGGINELGYLAVDAGGKRVFVSLKNKLDRKNHEFSYVHSCFVTGQGIYYSTNKGIFRWHKQKMEVIPFIPCRCGGLVHDGQPIIGQVSGGIYRFAGNQPQLLAGTEKVRLAELGDYFLLPLQQKKILIATQKKGFFIYDPQITSSPGRLRKFPSEITEYLRFHRLFWAGPGSQEQYLFGTLTGGLVIMDGRGKLVQVINKNRGLQDDAVLSAGVDRQQNIWATLNYGISHVEINSPISRFQSINGLKGMLTCSIRHQGRIYVSDLADIYYLKDYRLSILDDKQEFIKIKTDHDGFLDLIVTGKILLGCGRKGVYQIVADRAKLIIDAANVYSLCCSKKYPRHVFLGTGTGLAAMEILDSSPNTDFVKAKFIYGGRLTKIQGLIRKMICDPAGDLWLSSEYDGILYIRFKGADISDFQISRYTKKQGLPVTQKNTAHFIDDQLLVGTEKGVYRGILPSDPADHPEKIYFVPDTGIGKYFQAHPNRVVRIARDPDGDYWLSLINRNAFGIARRNRSGSYDWDEVPFKEVTGFIETFWLENDGIGWLSGVESKTLFRFDKKINKNYRPGYDALIRQVSIGQGTILFAGNYFAPSSRDLDHYLIASLRQPQQLMPRLPYRDNSLSFQYSATFYEHTGENRFQYQLQGYDLAWGLWTDKSETKYTNLPEGNYHFRVKAKNIFEHESRPAAYRFTIFPPWYRTYWSYTAYVVIFILFVYGLIRFNTRRLIAAKARLEKLVTERTAEVVRQKDEILGKNKEITRQKDEIEAYASNLYTTNRQLTEARNALWGEMELAKKIQTVLLPEQPKIPGYEIAACMKPADEVGGDYYDIINIVETHNHVSLHWVVVGDVSGHGVPAGLVMMMVQTAIRQAINTIPNESPMKILVSVNRTIYDNIKKLGEDKYMTITLMSVQENGLIHFSGLHQDIMIYRAEKKEVELVETQGMWIGMMDSIEGMIGVNQLSLQQADVLLLYTDGVTEATDANGQLFSEKKLQHIFQSFGDRSPQEIKEGILHSLGGYTCNDDITLLVMKRK